MPSEERTRIGRYVLGEEIASGGMATVHFGRLIGDVGFARTVAIKRLHRHLAHNPDFVAGFLDEARLAARIRHPNVVPTLDVIAEGGEVLLVMDYVQGETLARLLSRALQTKTPPPPAIVSAIVIGALHGLHAAHEARSESGDPLHIVHRDVSPQNILVGIDGMSRVLDFGVAKAVNRSQETKDGALKGKLGYMSPEHATGQLLDRRSDIFSAGIVLWEALTATRLYEATAGVSIVFRILHDPIPELPTTLRSAALSQVLERALAKESDRRYATALQFATALEAALEPASPHEVGAWLTTIASDALDRRARVVASIESERLVAAGPVAADASTEPTAPGRTRILLAAAGAVVSLIGLGGYAIGAKRAASSNVVPATVAAPEPTVEPPASLVASSAPAATLAPAIPPKVTAHAVRTPTPSSRAPATGANCQNPFYFDESGIKHIKPACVR